jgi:hypothetical protein
MVDLDVEAFILEGQSGAVLFLPIECVKNETIQKMCPLKLRMVHVQPHRKSSFGVLQIHVGIVGDDELRRTAVKKSRRKKEEDSLFFGYNGWTQIQVERLAALLVAPSFFGCTLLLQLPPRRNSSRWHVQTALGKGPNAPRTKTDRQVLRCFRSIVVKPRNLNSLNTP